MKRILINNYEMSRRRQRNILLLQTSSREMVFECYHQ